MKKIVFICQHNSCRSQIAQCIAGRILDPETYAVKSCGLYPGGKINEDARRLLERMYGAGALEGQHVKVMSPEILEGAWRIIALGEDIDTSEIPSDNVTVWDVSDPSGGETMDFLNCISVLKRKIREIK